MGATTRQIPPSRRELRRRPERVGARTAACLAVVSVLACGVVPEEPVARPNVLLILADDLGMNDLAAFGEGNAPTPHLDRLAEEGVRFTRHYAFSTCAPSRAALLTGLHPARLGFRPRGRGISGDVRTLADRLQQAGYATHHVGKWHLGTEPEATPGRLGFSSWLGFLEASDLGRRGPTYRDPWLRTGGAPPALTAAISPISWRITPSRS